MNGQFCGDGLVDEVEELFELDGPVAGGELVGDKAVVRLSAANRSMVPCRL